MKLRHLKMIVIMGFAGAVGSYLEAVRFFVLVLAPMVFLYSAYWLIVDEESYSNWIWTIGSLIVFIIHLILQLLVNRAIKVSERLARYEYVVRKRNSSKKRPTKPLPTDGNQGKDS